MNEGTKTGIFWAVAVAMLGVGIFVAWPAKSTDPTTSQRVGQLLFEKFTDPASAASMQILTFDEEQGNLATFEVRKDGQTGQWTIPSRKGYPADALAQMTDAANCLVGLKILDTQTSNAEDHDDLGVAEPNRDDLQLGDEGVGRMVTFKDASNGTLASVIIGDALKDDPQKRFVRVRGQDPVYVVKLDDSPLTTRFQDWIEADLLKLSSIDIEEITIRDYSAAIGPKDVLTTRNFDVTVTSDGSQWKLGSLYEYDSQDSLAEPTAVKLTGDEKLDKAKINGIVTALDDLRIVDVVRKPESLSGNPEETKDLMSDNTAVLSLAQRGFYPRPSASKEVEVKILSANGELSVTLHDGVRYLLRFGNVAGVTDARDAGLQTGDRLEAGVNRYLLVTTMVDPSKFPPPDLKPVPQTLEELDAVLDPTGEAQETDEELTEEERLERLDAEQEKITKENQRKMDERKDRLQAAGRRVRLLNARFADWYYVIAEDTFSQLRIKRDELFEPPAAGPDDATAEPAAKSETKSPADAEVKPAESQP